MRKKVFVAVGALVIYGCGYLSGQNTPIEAQSAVDTALMKQYGTAVFEARMHGLSENMRKYDSEGKPLPDADADKYANGPSKLSTVIHNATSSPTLSRHILSAAISDWEVSRVSAKSAPQISQAADEVRVKLDMLQIAQNQQIITLLQSIDRKTK